MKALMAKKIGMTSVFDDAGNAVPVTVLEAGPCVVTQLKSVETDGYTAVQLGFGEAKASKIGKSRAGHLKASKATAQHLSEFRPNDEAELTKLKVGDVLKNDAFEVGDMITVHATSKGKGFAGTIKRHNFSRGPKTHGSNNYRAPGSIGAGFPQHVFRGQKMAGQMGGDRVTVKNLPVVKIDTKNNLIALRGAVPGPNRGIVTLEVITPAPRKAVTAAGEKA